VTAASAAIVERWLSANPAHSLTQLHSGPRASLTAPPDLHALAQRELSIVGRYQLSRPVAPPAGEPWWLRALRWMAERWEQLWHALFGRVHIGSAQVASFGDVLLVIVGLLLLFVVYRLLQELYVIRFAARAASQLLVEAPAPRGLYRQACDAASRGDRGSAALLLFAATIALLDRRGAVDVTSSATVGDLRRALRDHNAELVAPFDAVAAPFVQRAYAERPVDEPQWQRARTAFETMVSP
jgi:hypothetical protein